MAEEEDNGKLIVYDLRCHSRGAGCGLKLPASDLNSIMEGLSHFHSDKSGVIAAVLDGYDYGAIALPARNNTLVQSVDLIAPVCAQPSDFGEIVVCHCISDVYVSGGLPLCALAVLVIPETGLPHEVTAELLNSIGSRLQKEGCSLLGGHTIRSGETLLVGLSVTGTIEGADLLRPSGAHQGDQIVLTKPLGTGLYIAADRHGYGGLNFHLALEAMKRANNCITSMRKVSDLHACVDVSGFGLCEALLQIARKSTLSISVDIRSLPFLPQAKDLAKEGFHTSLTDYNYISTRDCCDVSKLSEEDLVLVNDPQTSGGLLLAISRPTANSALDACRSLGFSTACVVGQCVERQEREIIFV